MFRCLLGFLALTSFSVYADPWGKDADLANRAPICISKPSSIKTPIIGPLGEALLHFYQTQITPIDGPRSHYLPSSSQYTREAMQKYGFFQGFLLGCDRLLRENDEEWIYPKTLDAQGCEIKWDPVP
jgi:putative component of membrane protein insertase Oxa1/YidC/SpoIIIJ protein YidD